MFDPERGRASLLLIAAVAGFVWACGAMVVVWTIVWRAPRAMPLGADEFWIDYVFPRAAPWIAALAVAVIVGACLAVFAWSRSRKR